MRAVWSGVISFGMVTVPVKMFGATEEKRVAFHQVHAADGGRVRQKRVCEIDGEEVALADVAKGLELPDGDVVLLTPDDFDSLPQAVAKTISVEAFVPEEQIDPIMYSKSYYLAPDKLGIRPYALLRDAMASSGRVAVVRFAMRERESLAALRVRDEVLVLETMLWADEIRAPEFDFLDSEVEPKAAELKMAELLIDSLSTDFDPADYHDHYREELQEVIDAKVAGREVVTPPAPVETGAQVIDLMAALKASVEAAKRTRGEAAAAGGSAGGSGDEDAGAEDAGVEDAEAAAPSKKAAAKAAAKTTASKTTAPKTTANKTPAARATASKTSAAKKATAKKAATPTRAAKGARAASKTADTHAKTTTARKKTAAAKSTPTRRAG